MLLAASGVSVHDHSFDTTIMTPGVVAAVGGFLLIGLGLALRVLQRIEHALAQRQVATAKGPGEPTQFPLPQKPALRPLAAAAAAPVTPAASARKKPVEDEPETIPVIARLEAARVAEDTELSSSPDAAPPLPTGVDLATSALDKTRSANRKNGSAPARHTPWLDTGARPPLPSERPAGRSFDTLWPKGPRPMRPAPPAVASAAAAPAVESEHDITPAEDEPQTLDTATEPVSVLKSGVVDGMAYTLYSDGSIEAQLPQGTLRFGSITELRNHIEQSA